MGEELQHLIERIRTDAVDEAQQQADAILKRARQEAADIKQKAESEARAHIEQAEKDAEVYTERSRKALDQAARDVLISVGQGIEKSVQELVREEVGTAMNGEVMQELLATVVESYLRKEGDISQIELLLGREDRDRLTDYIKGRYQAQIKEGLRIGEDDGIIKGFRISFKDGTAYHDFSREAIADALGQFLRPELAEVVYSAAHQTAEGAKG